MKAAVRMVNLIVVLVLHWVTTAARGQLKFVLIYLIVCFVVVSVVLVVVLVVVTLVDLGWLWF